MSIHPAWLENAIFYQIYPQSFCDSNGDGIGDIPGINGKLDYIRELGCNAVWMNPCFESPFLDAGYDVSDYYKVAPRYGTNDDLVSLFDEAHKHGMHIILDLVPGHTSWEHPWFKASMQAARNEYTDRYVWTDSVWEAPAGYGSLRGISERDGSCMVNFFTHQPALNYGFLKPERPWQQSMDAEGPRKTLQAMMDVMRFWLSRGCDGFRVDMAGSLVKNDADGEGNIALWQEVRAFLDREFPEAAIISEWGEPDKALRGGFHMDFLLHFGPSHYNDLFRCEEPYFSSRGKGDAAAFVGKYLEYYNKSQRKGLICIPSGNHDMDRLARKLHGDEPKTAFAFLLTMPGAPFIYYGDEIGMRYVEGLASVEGGYGRTGSRSPMQWDDSVNAGFSMAPAEKLYVPLDPSADRPTAAAQMADPASLRSEVKRLIALRQAHPALQNYGDIEFVHIGYPLMYTRSSDDETLLVIINPSAEEKRVIYSHPLGNCIYQLNGAALQEGNRIMVPAQSVSVFA